MYSGVLLAAGLGYYLFVYKGVDRMQQSGDAKTAGSSRNYPLTKSEAMKSYMYSKLPWNSSIGDIYVYAKSFPVNKLPDDERRQELLLEFQSNVSHLREAGRLPKDSIRYIDKVDMSLELTTVRALKPKDAVDLFSRQMRYLSMFTKQANPFGTVHKLIANASMFSRGSGPDFQPTTKFSGNFATFLQDYYFWRYYSTRNEWNIYLVQQQRKLDEVENDVFSFLNGDEGSWVTNEEGKIVTTCFSTVGLEVIANLLKIDRTIVPQLEKYEIAFTDEIWKNYFPYTWAEVNRKQAGTDLHTWARKLKK
ncbi:hypothetical protein [Levilactobacillus cerevisiae]|uniref:hypothetical protein n=1 Tax=Levilactobacillus cerevisiae TaxID=1704076 RepID=UPI000F7B44A2|nr:hypothetical protein [Levilactobacillus cerevisiae]